MRGRSGKDGRDAARGGGRTGCNVGVARGLVGTSGELQGLGSLNVRVAGGSVLVGVVLEVELLALVPKSEHLRALDHSLIRRRRRNNRTETLQYRQFVFERDVVDNLISDLHEVCCGQLRGAPVAESC